MSFTPYLFFAGDCREALTRYQEIFGGDLEVLTFGDTPPGTDGGMAADPEQVMHACLLVGGAPLYASDDPTGAHEGMRDAMVSHTGADADQARRVFDALADGGQVLAPFEPTSWSTGFGMCVDRFGIRWMIDAPAPEGTPAGG